MELKLFDSELKVLDVLWQDGEQTAGQLAKSLHARTGWNRNTTYTVIKKLIDKGAVVRIEPGFLCRPAITKEQVRSHEAAELIGKLFDGSAEVFLSAFFSGKTLTDEEAARLRALIEQLK